MNEKIFYLRKRISIRMNVLTFEEEFVGISSVSVRFTLHRKLDVKHFINENIHKSNILWFLVNIWCVINFKVNVESLI